MDMIKNGALTVELMKNIVLPGIVFLFVFPVILLGQAEESAGGEESGQGEASIQELVQHLSSDDRPVRQEAASKLVTNQSSEATGAVSRILNRGGDVEKGALLTAIVDKVGAEESISYLLEPLLTEYARQGNEKNEALIEAISYFDGRLILDSILKLLRKRSSVDGQKPSISMLSKARIIQLTGNEKLKLNPVRVTRRLLDVSDTLPQELHSEIVVALQQLYDFYSFSSFDDWKTWWNENRDVSEANRYRRLLGKQSSGGLTDWKHAIDRLFSLAGDQEVELKFEELLRTRDPRKLLFVLKKIREYVNGQGISPDAGPFISHLSERHSPRVQLALIQTVGKLELKEAREKVESFVGHYRPSIRKAAAAALGRVGNDASGELLVKQFEDETNDGVVIALLKAFKELNYRKAIFSMHDRLIRSSRLSPSVRIEIVSTLGSMGEKKSLSVLTSLLEETEPEEDVTLRFELALSIGQIGAVEGVPALIQLTQAPTPSVRGAAAQALGNIAFNEESDDDPEHRNSLDALFELLREAEDPTVKRRAAKSIAKIARTGTPRRLAELIVKRENGVEDVIRTALKNTLQRYLKPLSKVVSTLQEAGYHALVTELAAVRDKERFQQLDKQTRVSLLIMFVESHLKEGNWSDALSLLDNIESAESTQSIRDLSLLRVRANIGLGNYSKARSLLNELESDTEDTSVIWNVRYLRVRLLYEEGPPERALSYIRNELRPKSPPESINKRLQNLEKQHEQALEAIKQHLTFLLNRNNASEDARNRVDELLQFRPYREKIVRRVLDELPSSSGKIANVLTPALVRLLNSITGTSFNAEDTSDVQELEKALRSWNDWLDQRTAETGNGSSSSEQ